MSNLPVNGKTEPIPKAKRKLTDRQKVFVWEYLHCWNASEAARRAGYKTRSNEAGRLAMSNPDIRAAIDVRLAEMGMSANEVLSRLSEHARGDLAPFLNPEGVIDLTTPQAREHLYLIKKIKQHEVRGTNAAGADFENVDTEIELHDPQSALVHLGRHHKLFTDKIEQGGSFVLRVVYGDPSNAVEAGLDKK